MEVKKAIFERRSIRKYSNKPIPDETVTELIRAGMYAPSAGNQQSWEFYIIKDKEKINKIKEFHPYATMVRSAGALILVCGNTNREKVNGCWVQDCSAATQNMLLAAHDMGIGSVWLGIHPMEDRIAGAKKLFNLPEGIEPLSIISFGYPAEKKPIPERFNSKFIHTDVW
jgi:nitroreductase